MVAGISSATFYPLETEKAVDLAISLGFKDMEIFINSECEFDEDYIRKLRVKLDESGVRVRSLHPYTSAIEALYFFTQYSRRAVDAIKIYT
ncbi:MAG: sugar phosphate isomerase/epimerase, partial [Clostridia bacterium]